MEIARPGGREIDQFGTAYLMATEEARVVGSHRLVSCIGVTINVTGEAWREICRKRGVDRPVLVWNGLDAPVLGLLEPALRQTA